MTGFFLDDARYERLQQLQRQAKQLAEIDERLERIERADRSLRETMMVVLRCDLRAMAERVHEECAELRARKHP